MLGNVVFKATTHDSKKCVKAVNLLFEFTAIANSEARLLSFFVDACSIVTSTPSTSRLDSVAFHFSGLA